jgi:hypothetical protein
MRLLIEKFCRVFRRAPECGAKGSGIAVMWSLLSSIFTGLVVHYGLQEYEYELLNRTSQIEGGQVSLAWAEMKRNTRSLGAGDRPADEDLRPTVVLIARPGR